jgi:hypothetical protein
MAVRNPFVQKLPYTLAFWPKNQAFQGVAGQALPVTASIVSRHACL